MRLRSVVDERFSITSLSFQFYLFGFLVVFVLARIGHWIPTAYILHLLGEFKC